MNNIIANTATAVTVDAVSSSKTVLEANLYQNNTSNGAGGSEQFAIQLQPTDPLFVDAANNDFYLAEGSKAIDSSLNSLQDRPAMVQVDAPLGIPAEPIIAPAYDELGQLRVDDPSVSSPPGLGQNVYIDRGALDRADFVDPTAVLYNPAPNNSATPNVATVIGQFPSQFQLQFQDGTGTGVDPGTVSIGQFTLTGPDPNNPSNTITLQPTLNYLFSYDATNHIVRFTAAAGVWTPGTYTITVNNKAVGGVADLAGNPLAPNNSTGTTTFTITVAAAGTSPWQNPVNSLDVNGDGSVSAIDALVDINALNQNLFPGGVLPLPATAPPYYDVNGDGLLTPLDVLTIINYLNSHSTVTAVASPTSSPATASTSSSADVSTPTAALSAAVETGLAVGTVSAATTTVAPAVSPALATAVPSSTGAATTEIGFGLAANRSTATNAAVVAAGSSSGGANSATNSGDFGGSTASDVGQGAATAVSAVADPATHDSVLGTRWDDDELDLEMALSDLTSNANRVSAQAWSDESDNWT